ncbi:MAG: class I SAM-dependent methyltransferase, partial [Acidobacteriota bacterium]
GETIPLDNESVDGVVTTWTLCTIPDVIQALGEMRRVLKEDGCFHFLEHGRSDDPRVARWQDRLNPIQNLVGGGCNINRKIDDLIRAAGFEITSIENFYMKGLRVGTYMYSGVARRTSS